MPVLDSQVCNTSLLHSAPLSQRCIFNRPCPDHQQSRQRKIAINARAWRLWSRRTRQSALSAFSVANIAGTGTGLITKHSQANRALSPCRRPGTLSRSGVAEMALQILKGRLAKLSLDALLDIHPLQPTVSFFQHYMPIIPG